MDDNRDCDLADNTDLEYDRSMICPMIIVNPSSRSNTRIGLAYASNMSSSLTPCFLALPRYDRVAHHNYKLPCLTVFSKLACIASRKPNADRSPIPSGTCRVNRQSELGGQ